MTQIYGICFANREHRGGIREPGESIAEDPQRRATQNPPRVGIGRRHLQGAEVHGARVQPRRDDALVGIELGRDRWAREAYDDALQETQFSKAVKRLKDAIPSKLLILDGKNPLTLLHRPLAHAVRWWLWRLGVLGALLQPLVGLPDVGKGWCGLSPRPETLSAFLPRCRIAVSDDLAGAKGPPIDPLSPAGVA